MRSSCPHHASARVRMINTARMHAPPVRPARNARSYTPDFVVVSRLPPAGAAISCAPDRSGRRIYPNAHPVTLPSQNLWSAASAFAGRTGRGTTRSPPYGTYHEREYFAFRHAAGLIDVTPLFKYEVRGPDAGAFLAKVMVRTSPSSEGPWSPTAAGATTTARSSTTGRSAAWRRTHFRVTAAESHLAWL